MISLSWLRLARNALDEIYTGLLIKIVLGMCYEYVLGL